jgi:hypothetical protein
MPRLFSRAPALVLALGLAACVGELGAGPAGPTGVGPRPRPVDCASGTAIAPSDRLPRLTFDQYDRAVSALVGIAVRPSAELGGDPGDVFTRQLLDGIETAARSVAEQLAADDAAFARIAPCTPASAAEETACASTVIATFGRRAYRRPLSDAETAAYAALFADRATLTETGSFREGIALLVEAFLQSPGFLLRAERSTEVRDGRIPLSSFELAQRLAFALWGSVPDDELLDAAATGALASPDEVRRQAERLLADPQARDLVRAEHRHWLGMEGSYAHFWTNVRRDSHPEFAGVTDADLHDDVLRSLERIALDDDGGLRELLTSPRAVVNERTAPLYGLTETFTGWTPVDLDPEARPGLLTRAGFLASHARSSRPSLIYRGAFVVQRILCEPIGSPPAGAESTPLPETAGLVTTRERIDAMTSSGACTGCHHGRINPAGYAFEGFDEIGRARTIDNGAPVDTTGTLRVGAEDIAYDDPASFARELADSSQAQACYARRWVEFTYDRDAAAEDACTIGALGDRLSEEGYSVRDLLIELVQTDAFLYRAATEAE